MRQVALFLVSVFGVTWTLLFFLRPVSAQGELWTVLAWLLPTVWSPTIIALILMRSVEGAPKGAVRASLTYRRGSARWLILAGIVPALATASAVFIARAAGDGVPFIPSAAILPMLILQLLTGAVGEELGWRGFLLPRLGKQFGDMAAAWVMAILWSLWHVAAFFFPGTPHNQLMPPIPTLLSIALFGVFLAFVFHRTGESVLATILAHLSLNITMGMGGVRLSSIAFWWTMVGIFGALALVARRMKPTAAQQAAEPVGHVIEHGRG
jgi:CAAX protease family protein